MLRFIDYDQPNKWQNGTMKHWYTLMNTKVDRLIEEYEEQVFDQNPIKD